MADFRTMSHGKPVQIAVVPETEYRHEELYVLLDNGMIMCAAVTINGWSPWTTLPALPEVGESVPVHKQAE